MMQKRKIFILAALSVIISASTAAFAAEPTKTITVMGVNLEAKNITYFADSNDIHSFNVVNPTTFTFARGNTFTASDTVYLYKSGSISSISSKTNQEIIWTSPDNRTSTLDCSVKLSPSFDKIARIVSFHENKEYKGGCASNIGIDFVTDEYKLLVFGNLDVTADFKLIYAQKSSGSIKMGEKNIRLYPGREIAIHPNGNIRFFTPDKGETFSMPHPSYGKLTFTQREDKPVSTSFFEDETVERGILAEDIIHNELKLRIGKYSGVSFSKEENYLIDIIIFFSPIEIKAQEYTLSVNSFRWDTKRKFYDLSIAAPFTLTLPDTGALLNVPAGSIVGLDYSWKIVGVMMPRKSSEVIELAPTRF